MKINIVPDSTVSLAPAGFASTMQAAAQLIEQQFGGNYTLNIAYGWGSYNNQIDPSLINGTFAEGGDLNGANISYSSLKSWLLADALTSDQQAAYSFLPSSTSAFPGGQNTFYVTSAEEKALGHFSGSTSAMDGAVGFGTGLSSGYWMAAALHEITHAMGRETDVYAPTVMDLFRYSAPGHYQWTGGRAAYLSFDGGATVLANYDTRSDYSDFAVDSHTPNDPFDWQVSSSENSLTSLDLELMNVLGFSRLNGPTDLGTHGNWQISGVGDFNGDGTTDVLWRSPSDGFIDEWQIKNGAWSQSISLGSGKGTDWSVAVVADFNGDGASDIVWRNNVTHSVDQWQMKNGNWSKSIDLGGTNYGSDWQLAGAGDFNGDGISDLVWRDPSLGYAEQWQMKNGNWAATTPLGNNKGADWTIAGIGDFNHDGFSDVLWQNSKTGQVDEWQMKNGNWAQSIDLGKRGAEWKVAGVGDFTKDGSTDILWYNTQTGYEEYWKMANGNWAGSVAVGTQSASLTPAGVGDFNHDGVRDALWLDTSTQHVQEQLSLFSA